MGIVEGLLALGVGEGGEERCRLGGVGRAVCLCGVRVGGPALLAESRQRPDALLQPGVQLREGGRSASGRGA